MCRRVRRPIPVPVQPIRLVLLTVFIVSVAAMVTVRSPARRTEVEGGRYFVHEKNLRYEITRAGYERNERVRWRNTVSAVAAVAMVSSLLAFIGVESVWSGGWRFRWATRGRRR